MLIFLFYFFFFCFFFSSRRRHTRCLSDWSSDVCSSDLHQFYYLVSLIKICIRIHIKICIKICSSVNLINIDKVINRSEERRVGKECRYRWSKDHYKKKKKAQRENDEKQSVTLDQKSAII